MCGDELMQRKIVPKDTENQFPGGGERTRFGQ